MILCIWETEDIFAFFIIQCLSMTWGKLFNLGIVIFRIRPNVHSSLFFYIIAEEFILENPKDYDFLLRKGLLPVPGVDDAAEFQSTVNAMNIMGMTNEDYSGMMVISWVFFSFLRMSSLKM